MVAKLDWKRAAITAWAVVATIIFLRLVTVHNVERQSLYPAYIGAARHWIAGETLYGPNRLMFRYSPLFAAGFTAFNLFPDRLGNILWRAFSLTAYATALVGWMNVVLREPRNQTHRGWFLLLALPLSIGSLNNGQVNTLLVALILAAFAHAQRERFMLASVLVAIAIHLKLHPLAFGAAIVLLWPLRMWWRLPLALFAVTGLCFVLQYPSYVGSQFRDWFLFLRSDLRLEQDPADAYRDLRLLFHVIGVAPSHLTYFLIQLIGMGTVMAACVVIRSSAFSRQRCLATVYTLVACAILLLGPSTESSTYILLAPALAWFGIELWTGPHPVVLRFLFLSACTILGVAMVANWFPFVTKIHALGLHPLAVMIFLSCFAYDLVTSRTDSTAPLPAPAPQID
jgi:hypothetical protein